MTATGIQFAVQRSGWSAENVQEEMFLFDDEDLLSPTTQNAKNNNNNNNNNNYIRTKTVSPINIQPVINDLEFLQVGDGTPNKTGSFFRRPYFHLYGNSPSEIASSCDSEISASITIEGLRDHLQSCFTCGVLWRENQASLDCHECDGYALSRPCMECDGSCAAVWTRDLTISHQTGKAKFNGTCKLSVILRNCSIETAQSCESQLS